MLYSLTDKEYEDLRDHPSLEDCYGCIYCGALCFDIIPRFYTYGTDYYEEVDLDCYILGVDSGYGILEDGTPYDQAPYIGATVDFPRGLSKKEFLQNCKDEINNYIDACNLEHYLSDKYPKWIDHIYDVVIELL